MRMQIQNGPKLVLEPWNPGTPGTPPSFFSMDHCFFLQAFGQNKGIGKHYPVETSKKNSGCLGFQVVGRAFFLTQW